MNLDTMSAVYTALAAGLPNIPVTRAWPQTKPYLPGCTYQLANWSLEKDGSKKTEILVTLRVLQQSQGDQLSDLAVAALAPLGYVLQHAQDAQEQETGFFLRLLWFFSLADVPAPPPQPQPEPLPVTWEVRLRIDTAWHTLDFPVDVSFKPDLRELINQTPFSSTDIYSPRLDLSPIQNGSVLFTSSQPLFAGHTVVDALRLAFLNGADARFSVRRLTPLPAMATASFFTGPILAFHRSSLGLYCQLALRFLAGGQ